MASAEDEQLRMQAILKAKLEASDRHREQVRSLLAKSDPALLAFCDAAKDRFDARLTGLRIQTELGWEAAGQLANHDRDPKP